jgi:Icc-related predicted phosphoesterase
MDFGRGRKRELRSSGGLRPRASAAYHAGVSIYIVSDLHGASDELRKAVPEGGTLLLLGDLINFLDYTSMTGILTEVFSVDAVQEVVDLRTAGRVEEARDAIRRRASGREEEIRSEIGVKVTEQYERVFSALTTTTYLILGNVDNPAMASHYAAENPLVHEADAQVITLEGERFAFIGGALPTPLHVAGEISEDEMKAKVEGLGEADILCSHIPPAVPELCFDTLAGRAERGSKDLLRYIEDVQPRRAYFGHVHQPLMSSMYIGATQCINVGYFRSIHRAFPHVLRSTE